MAPKRADMFRPRILIIEDCDDLRSALCETLRSEFEIDSVRDAETALQLISQKSFELVLVDVGLPKMDGYKFCASLKSQEGAADIPVIFLSGRTDVEDKLLGFSAGGSDFVSKPCDRRELKARIKIQLQIRNQAQKNAQNLEVGPFSVNLASQGISYISEATRFSLSLSPLEFKLLHFFLTHIDHVLTRNQLMDHVWGDARYVNDRSVDATISKLRQKLGPHEGFLQSVRGQGYRFSDPAPTKIELKKVR